MRIEEIAIAIAHFTPHERERLGEELLAQLSPTQIAELLCGLARVGEDRSFNTTGKSHFIGDIIGDAAKRLTVEGMFSEETHQERLF